jgi:hypothetical protein
MKTYGGVKGIASSFLTSPLDDAVIFEPLSLYPWYPRDRKLGEPQSRS